MLYSHYPRNGNNLDAHQLMDEENVQLSRIEYYLYANKIKTMTFTEKWMELEIIILSEVTESQRDSIIYSFSYIDLSFHTSDICVPFGISTEAGNYYGAMEGDLQEREKGV